MEAVLLRVDPVARPLLRHSVGLVEEPGVPGIAIRRATRTRIRAVPPIGGVVTGLRHIGPGEKRRFLLQRDQHDLRVDVAGDRKRCSTVATSSFLPPLYAAQYLSAGWLGVLIFSERRQRGESQLAPLASRKERIFAAVIDFVL